MPTALLRPVRAKGYGYRLEEANSFWNSGRKDVSDTQGSALWGLDYLYWWASRGCAGINLHTGDYVAREDENARCNYAAFWASAAGYEAHPIAYGIKAFDLGGHGQLVPAVFTDNQDKVNMTAYGVVASDKSLYVTLINKEHDAGAREAKVTIAAKDSYRHGEVMFLVAPHGDVAATSGITLGGALIQEDGTWNGHWTALAPASATGRFTINLPAASAAVVRLRMN